MMTPCGPGASGRPYRHTRAVGLSLRSRYENAARDAGSESAALTRVADWLSDSGHGHGRWELGPVAGGRGSADSWGEVRADFLRSGYASAANGSTVVGELALRPGFSPQARMPPTARCASRGERRGLLVLTAGPVSCSAGVTPPARWPRPNPVERAGFLALFLARGSNRGMGRRGDDDANRTGLGSASARRVGS